MPLAIYALGLAVFAQGTSEFMLSGLVSSITRDLNVSIPAAGSLTSAFAVGMIIGAPVMAALSLRWPKRRALLTFLVTFMLVHVIGALTTDFAVLVATRVIGALANAGFLAVALVAATELVAPNAKARATSALLGGVTIACVAGVPAGAWLGQLWGWRAAFWAVALVSVPAIVAILRSVPTGTTSPPTTALSELRSLRDPRLGVTLTLGALVNGATFCVFTYLAPILTNVTGLDETWVPLLLALFGIGSFAGVTLSGRLADTRSTALLLAGGAALLVGWATFGVVAARPIAAIVLIGVQATLAFAVGSTLISRVMYVAIAAPRLAGGMATAAFNVGAALGPWLGGATIGADLGFVSPLWVSALLVAVAFAVGLAAHVLGRGPTAELAESRYTMG